MIWINEYNPDIGQKFHQILFIGVGNLINELLIIFNISLFYLYDIFILVLGIRKGELFVVLVFTEINKVINI